MPRVTGQGHDGPRLDFCVLGAPNSGKSALQGYLWTHPRVFMPASEPNFYADDVTEYGSDLPRPKNRQAYRALFAGAAEGQLLGEMSGRYLFSERAVPSLLRDSPDARFILMLRNPVDMAHSIHSHLLRNSWEDERSFEKAWELQEARAAGKRIPPGCKRPKILLYRDRCSFAPHIERLFQQVPRERVLVHLFEEFFADLRGSYLRTLAFLGLPDDGRTHFERVNEHGVARSRLLLHLALHPPFYRPLKRAFNTLGLRPGLAFFRWTVGKESSAPMDKSFRRRLAAEFQPDIARLESILGRALNVWTSH